MAARARRLARHLIVKPWPVWLTLGGILGVGVLAAVVGDTPGEHAAWTGAGLEIAGLGTVAYGLHRLRKNFKRPSVGSAIRDWFKQLTGLFRKPAPVTIQVQAAAYSISGASAHLSVKAGPGSTLDRRVEILEGEVERLRERFDGELVKHERTLESLRADLAREQRERAEIDGSLQRTVEEFAVGGLYLEGVGLVWLFVGVLLGTLPERSAAAIWELGATVLRGLFRLVS